MEWVRGQVLGRGSFGVVSLAIPKSTAIQTPPAVVKSSDFSAGDSLRHEKEVISELSDNHPNIIRCFGDSLSFEKGTQIYNLFLEYAGKGSLADQLRISGGRFEYSDVKKYTKAILKGLSHIHAKGFVHCDIKLQNILLFDDGVAKIADFGLAKRVSDISERQLRGTPMNMSPEIVAGGRVGSPADVWALGCCVVEMISGKPAWDCSPECDVSGLIYRIGIRGESPKIPGNLCAEGRDFLGKCFVKDPNERWTVQMLLDHPFISGFDGDDDHQPSVSPRCPFEFPDCESTVENSSFDSGLFGSLNSFRFSDVAKILGSDRVPDWSDLDGWVTIR